MIEDDKNTGIAGPKRELICSVVYSICCCCLFCRVSQRATVSRKAYNDQANTHTKKSYFLKT